MHIQRGHLCRYREGYLRPEYIQKYEVEFATLIYTFLSKDNVSSISHYFRFACPLHNLVSTQQVFDSCSAYSFFGPQRTHNYPALFELFSETDCELSYSVLGDRVGKMLCHLLGLVVAWWYRDVEYFGR